MAAKDMAARGEKTRAKVLKALGKKPKSAAEVASKVGVSPGFVRKILVGFAGSRKVATAKKGNATLYSVPHVPPKDVAQVTHSEAKPAGWRDAVDSALSLPNL